MSQKKHPACVQVLSCDECLCSKCGLLVCALCVNPRCPLHSVKQLELAGIKYEAKAA
jgi:hypothetical protein